jgi:N-acetylmuramoyl-L-alanine amidase
MATPIMGDTVATANQAFKWAEAKGAHGRFVDVIRLYYQQAPQLGVRADVALAQSAKETRYGQYGGTVPPEYHNWCGLKTTKGGSNSDPSAHAQFPDDATGVRAHLEHLHLYAAGAVANPVDPRHFTRVAGTAHSVEALGGKWAPSSTYGNSIVDGFLTPLIETPAPEVFIVREGEFTEHETGVLKKLVSFLDQL